MRDLEAGALSTQINLIVYSLAEVNARLKRVRPFFVDIVRDGIALHDTPDYPFDPPTHAALARGGAPRGERVLRRVVRQGDSAV